MSSILMTVANAIAALAFNALWQGALLVAAVWLLLRAWRGLNAVTRYAVWSLTLCAAVAIPIVTTTFVLSAGAKAPVSSKPVSQRAAPSRAASASEPTARTPVAPVERPASRFAIALPARAQLTMPAWVAGTVAAACTLFALVWLVRLAIGLARLELLKRDALPLPVEYRDAMQRWNAACKGGRDVRLCTSDAIDVPVAIGLFDAMILIPHVLLERLSPDEVDQISLHELAHLRRADDWTNGLQRIAVALFPWNPAVQFAGAQLDLEREVACDDWVLSMTRTVRSYAMCLTKMAETAAWPSHPIAAPGAFNTRRNISLRIERLLAAGRNMATNLSSAPTAAAIAIVGGVGILTGAVAPVVASPISPPLTVSTPPALAAPPKQSAPAPATKNVVRAMTSGVTVPAMHVRVPQINVQVPATSVHVPAADVHVPATDVHVPAIDVHVPGANVRVPAVNVDVPGKTIAIPSIDAHALENEVNASLNSALKSAQVAQRGEPGGNYSGVDWSGRDLSGRRYRGANFSKATLVGTNFSNGTFSNANFDSADLQNAVFRNAAISNCNFASSNLGRADFTNATISNCDFESSNLEGARFAGATLANCSFAGARVAGVDFSKTRLIDTDLPGRSAPP
jgi:beta-lactamase regulating signal transducer with metallopeptidase domain